MDTTGYTYTSTTTDANGNVVSETKKSSTKTGGTEKVQHTEKFPYVTYYDQNIALDRDRYVGEPGKVEERNNAIGLQTLEPGKNIRKDSGVLNMSEKDFSYLDYLSKHNPTSQEDFRKGVFKAYHKDVKSGKPWTAGELKDAIKDIKFKADKNKLARHSYAGSKLDSYGNLKLGEKIGNVISGDASCGDMGEASAELTAKRVRLPITYNKDEAPLYVSKNEGFEFFGNSKNMYNRDSNEYLKKWARGKKVKNFKSIYSRGDDLSQDTSYDYELEIKKLTSPKPYGTSYSGLDLERIEDLCMATDEQVEDYINKRDAIYTISMRDRSADYSKLPKAAADTIKKVDDEFYKTIMSNKDSWCI